MPPLVTTYVGRAGRTWRTIAATPSETFRAIRTLSNSSPAVRTTLVVIRRTSPPSSAARLGREVCDGVSAPVRHEQVDVDLDPCQPAQRLERLDSCSES